MLLYIPLICFLLFFCFVVGRFPFGGNTEVSLATAFLIDFFPLGCFEMIHFLLFFLIRSLSLSLSLYIYFVGSFCISLFWSVDSSRISLALP